MQAEEEKFHLALADDLAKNFALDIVKADLNVDNFFEQIQTRLSQQIFNLIQNDYNRLLAILYRIDVDEKTVSESLGGVDIFMASDSLAKAVIERMIKKARYRMQGWKPQD